MMIFATKNDLREQVSEIEYSIKNLEVNLKHLIDIVIGDVVIEGFEKDYRHFYNDDYYSMFSLDQTRKIRVDGLRQKVDYLMDSVEDLKKGTNSSES